MIPGAVITTRTTPLLFCSSNVIGVENNEGERLDNARKFPLSMSCCIVQPYLPRMDIV